MLRSSLIAAASVLVLSACQPASEAPTDAVVAETPPIEVEDMVEVVVEDTAANAETEAVAVTDSDEETHDHDEAHSDDDHNDDDHDDHAHGDDHDHDDHDHAGSRPGEKRTFMASLI